ncbi:MAG: SEC-C domain-containing protein, partial [Gemmatimonadetes bacterium]|nr:SEC-C domain-containing protein [Gemmatimonadota bacterium]
ALLEHVHATEVVSHAFEQRLALDQSVDALSALVKSGANSERQVADDKPPFVHQADKTGRNDPCPCGSGKKFKKCHGKGD